MGSLTTASVELTSYFTMLDLVGKSICCILCRGSILYFDETGATKFGRHMQFEHGAMHDLDFMMAACKMNDSEKKALVDVFNKQVETAEVDIITPNIPKKAEIDKETQSAQKKSINDEKLTKVDAETKTPTGKIKDNNNVLDEEKEAITKVSKDKKVKRSKDTTGEVKVAKDNIDLDEKPKDKKETKQQKALKEPTSDQKQNKKVLVMKSKSKQLARYTSKVTKNNKDSKTKAERSNCYYCEKIFKNEQKLTKHMEKEYPNKKIKSKLYSCAQCALSFRLKSALKDHVKIKHVKIELIVKEVMSVDDNIQPAKRKSVTISSPNISQTETTSIHSPSKASKSPSEKSKESKSEKEETKSPNSKKMKSKISS